MKQVLLIFILVFFCIAGYAQQQEDSVYQFQANVRCGNRDIPMTFVRHSNPKYPHYVIAGIGIYGSPAIDTTAAGRLVVPDSVSDPLGRRYLVWALGRQTFAHCTQLTEIDLPDGLKEIGDQAFLGCTRLREVTLPKALRVIYPFAFRDCHSLSVIRLHAPTRPAVYDDVFDLRTLDRATLIIPAGTSELYSNSLVWGLFHYTMEDFDP